MARRRMIGRSVLESDAFLELNIAAKALYPFIVLNADDNGLLNNLKMLTRTFNVQDNALGQLLRSGFLLDLGNGVYAVTHWEQQNHVPGSKFTPTLFPEEFARLTLKEDGSYELLR